MNSGSFYLGHTVHDNSWTKLRLIATISFWYGAYILTRFRKKNNNLTFTERCKYQDQMKDEAVMTMWNNFSKKNSSYQILINIDNLIKNVTACWSQQIIAGLISTFASIFHLLLINLVFVIVVVWLAFDFLFKFLLKPAKLLLHSLCDCWYFTSVCLWRETKVENV